MAKFGVLVVLAKSDQPLALSDLARKRSCVRSNVTQLVDRMEQEGLVERRRDDPEDRRSVKAALTAEGRRRFEAGAQALARAERELFKSFNQDELDFLGRLLLRLAL